MRVTRHEFHSPNDKDVFVWFGCDVDQAFVRRDWKPGPVITPSYAAVSLLDYIRWAKREPKAIVHEVFACDREEYERHVAEATGFHAMSLAAKKRRWPGEF